MVDGAVKTPGRAYVAGVVAAALALGVLAFTADSVDGLAGQVLVAFTSSGFAWGLVAFLAGRSAVGARQAVVGATALLTLATLLYYLLVLVVSRRWSGATLEDGSSADLDGLRSVAVMTALWLGGSLVAGPALGLLGQVVRFGRAWSAAVAAGLTCGLLSGEGWQAMVEAPPWRLLRIADPYHAEFFRGVVISELVKIVLPLAVLVWLATVHRLWRVWPTLLVAAISGGVVSALLWHLLHVVSGATG